MKVGVGSKNKTKIDAIAQLLVDYPMFAHAEVEGVDVNIEEFGHPKSLEETVAGAIDRAKQAQMGRDYGLRGNAPQKHNLVSEYWGNH